MNSIMHRTSSFTEGTRNESLFSSQLQLSNDGWKVTGNSSTSFVESRVPCLTTKLYWSTKVSSATSHDPPKSVKEVLIKSLIVSSFGENALEYCSTLP